MASDKEQLNNVQDDAEAVEDIVNEDEKQESSIAKSGFSDLPHGEAMKFSETYRITASKRANLILLAGEVGSGKTTLLSSLFHLYQRGPYAGYLFAGSDTLIGFERRCHPARTSSENAAPETHRTLRGNTKSFLHLRLRDKKIKYCSRELLIVDLSGEDFAEASHSVEDAKRLVFIQRADHFVLLIDGDKIANSTSRRSAKNKAMMLLRTLSDSGILTGDSNVDIVLSKWDIVHSRLPEDPSHQMFIDELNSDIDKKYGKRFARIRFFNIAARPSVTSSDIPLGYGLEQVLPSWIEDNKRTEYREYALNRQNASEFNCFAERVLRGK